MRTLVADYFMEDFQFRPFYQNKQWCSCSARGTANLVFRLALKEQLTAFLNFAWLYCSDKVWEGRESERERERESVGVGVYLIPVKIYVFQKHGKVLRFSISVIPAVLLYNSFFASFLSMAKNTKVNIWLCFLRLFVSKILQWNILVYLKTLRAFCWKKYIFSYFLKGW